MSTSNHSSDRIPPLLLYQSYKKLNDSLIRIFEIAAVNNDFIHQIILNIPNLSQTHKLLLHQAKAYGQLSSKENLMDIINNYLRPIVAILNTVIDNIHKYIEIVSNTPDALFYFDRHELHYALDFYRSIHSSVFEQVHNYMEILLST